MTRRHATRTLTAVAGYRVDTRGGAQNDEGWRLRWMPYALLADPSGSVAMHGNPANLDPSVGDVADRLDIGAIPSFEER